MKEYLIVSGRDISLLYPHYDVWGIGIPIYLFLGGLGAGILIFAMYFYLTGKTDKYPLSVYISPIFAPIILGFGSFLLIFDLHHPLYVWQLFTHLRFQSPMSWGAWTLTVVTILSLIWVLTFTKEIIEYFKGVNRKKWVSVFEWIDELMYEKARWLGKIIDFFRKYRNPIAIITFALSIVLGIYTGILLSTMNARPMWNTPILGILFLTSGLSTAAALNMWLSADHHEKHLYSKVDIFLVVFEMYLIFQLFFNMVQGPEIQVQTAQLFFGGEFTAIFWTLFVGLGLVLPWLLELLEIMKFKVPYAVPAFLILYGGLVFRIIMVIAGQVSAFLPVPTILH